MNIKTMSLYVGSARIYIRLQKQPLKPRQPLLGAWKNTPSKNGELAICHVHIVIEGRLTIVLKMVRAIRMAIFSVGMLIPGTVSKLWQTV